MDLVQILYGQSNFFGIHLLTELKGFQKVIDLSESYRSGSDLLGYLRKDSFVGQRKVVLDLIERGCQLINRVLSKLMFVPKFDDFVITFSFNPAERHIVVPAESSLDKNQFKAEKLRQNTAVNINSILSTIFCFNF